MKILHLIDSGGLYGAESVLLALVAEQVSRGDEPLILSAGTPDSGEKPLETAARSRGLPVMPWRMRSGVNLRQAYSIIRFARREGFRVLHSHGYKFNILMGLFPRAMRGIPLVSTLHGYTNIGGFNAMWWYEAFDRLMLRRCERVVVVSPAMRAMPALATIEPQRLVDVPNGITLPELRLEVGPDTNTLKFLAEHPEIVGAIGRLSPEKGLLELLEAFAALSKRRANLGLLLVGEGRQRGELEERAAKLGIASRVHFAGFRSPASVYMSRCDVLAMPSHTEGLPVTLLEAMALGVPVVASAVGAIPVVLRGGEFGELVEPRNSEALANALERVLKDSSGARERAERARLCVASCYSASAMAARYAGVYEDAARTACHEPLSEKRIHFLMDFLANPHAGTESQAIKLMDRLQGRGWRTDAGFFVSSAYLESGGFPVPFTVLGIRRMASPLTLCRLIGHAARLKRRGVRVVHIFFNDASLIAPPILKLFGLKVIISRRDMGFWYTPRLKRLLRLTGRFVDRAVCNSQAVLAATADAEGIPAKRLRVVHNGYDSPDFGPDDIGGASGPVVGIVANLRPIKRIDDLIRAFAEVARMHPYAELHIVGAGDSEPLKRLAGELCISEAVRFMGSRPDAARLVQRFDVAVLCSESEGMSNAIIEYLQAGKPVVCTRTGGNPEIVEDGVNGYLVAVGDVSALAGRICRLLSDPNLARRMGEEGITRVRARFSTDAMVSAYESLYRELGAA